MGSLAQRPSATRVKNAVVIHFAYDATRQTQWRKCFKPQQQKTQSFSGQDKKGCYAQITLCPLRRPFLYLAETELQVCSLLKVFVDTCRSKEVCVDFCQKLNFKLQKQYEHCKMQKHLDEPY